MPRKTYYGNEARAILKKGVDALGDAVRVTLGPKGRNAVIHRGYGAPIVTKDGVTVAEEMIPEDAGEAVGAELVRQAAKKTNDAVGDGTTTSTVLAQDLVRLMTNALETDPALDVHALRSALESRCQEICLALDAQAMPVATDLERLTQVATISANNDHATGKLIAELLHDLGKDGAVTVDDGNEIGLKVERVEGMRYERGVLSKYMLTDYERMVAELGDVSVLVTDYRITSVAEMLSIYKPVMEEGRKNLLLICDALEGDALTTVVANGPAFKKTCNVIATTPPGYGDRKKEMLQDICALTGATLISLELGKKLETITFADYGRADKVASDVDRTTIVGGKGSKDAIALRLSEARSALTKAVSDFDKEKLRERVAKLQGGVAVIRIGALTETEAKEKKYLIEDALNAVRAAMLQGIVAGGGIALRNAATGTSLLDEACHAPFYQILQNAGKTTVEIPAGGGYDAKADKPVPDMLAAGIVDPVSVTKSALQNALSVACSILTTETLVVEVPEEK